MSVEHVDNDWMHLYPQFRDALRATLAEAAEAVGQRWVLVEGYRSQARQDWLYAQGRTRPGKIVTWMRSPKWHGTGLAADVRPDRTGYAAPRAWWETLQHIGHQHGLHDPPWVKGDLGHLQLDVPEDGDVHRAALEWVRKGFPVNTPTPGPQAETARLIIDGVERPGPLVGDGHGHLRLEVNGESMAIRNVFAGLGFGPVTWSAGPPQTVEVSSKP